MSEEAYCQTRGQLTLGFWRNLWRTLSHCFEDRFTSSWLWKDTFRLLAVDGSDVDLPIAAKVTQFFGQPRNQHGQRHQPQAKLVSLCSMLTGFCIDFKLVGKRFTEHPAWRHFIRRLRRNDLVLMDRGFFPYRAMWQLPLKHAHFCFDCPISKLAMYESVRELAAMNGWSNSIRLVPYAVRIRTCPGFSPLAYFAISDLVFDQVGYSRR